MITGIIGRLARSRLLAHIISLGGAIFGVAVVKAALAAVIARVYGAGQFGEFAAAFAYCQLVGIFFDLGVGEWALYERARSTQAGFVHRTVTKIFAVTTLLFGTAGLLLRPVLVAEPAARPLVVPLLIINWAYAGQTLMQALLRARFRVGAAARIRTVQVASNSVVLGIAVVARPELLQLLWMVAGLECLILVAFWIRAREPETAPDVATAPRRGVGSELLPFSVAHIAIYVYLSSDAYVLSWFHSADAVGQYVAASRVYLLGVQVVALLINAALPMLYADGKSGSLETFAIADELQRAFAYVLGLVGMVGAPVAVWLLYGPGFDEASFVLSALMIGLVIRGVGNVPASTLTALGLQRRRTTIQVMVAVFNVCANLYAIPKFGIWGALSTTISSDALLIFGYCIAVARVNGGPLGLRDMIRYVATVVIIGGIWCITIGILRQPVLTAVLGVVGAYVLRIRIAEPFGRLAAAFKRGESVALARA